MKKIVLITDANRGLGLETDCQMAALDYQVILTSRNAADEQVVANKLGVYYHPIYVTQALPTPPIEDPNNLEKETLFRGFDEND